MVILLVLVFIVVVDYCGIGLPELLVSTVFCFGCPWIWWVLWFCFCFVCYWGFCLCVCLLVDFGGLWWIKFGCDFDGLIVWWFCWVRYCGFDYVAFLWFCGLVLVFSWLGLCFDDLVFSVTCWL